MKGRQLLVSNFGASGGMEQGWSCERQRSQREADLVDLLNRTVEEVAASGRAPELGYHLKSRRLFGRPGRTSRQVRGWIYRVDTITSKTSGTSNNSGHTTSKYRAVMETGVFLSTTSALGLVTDSEYESGRRVGAKSFGYVGFADGFVHFNTTSDAIELLRSLRTAFDLPPIEAFLWRS